MRDITIRVENLSKHYKIGVAMYRHDTLRDQIMVNLKSLFGGTCHPSGENGQSSSIANHPSSFWALRDVSFEVKRGEVLGIIGRNGAGKSTLLKILSRVTRPTYGRARINGRVGSLLEVGTGFHPELTGRENIFLNGAVLGMTKAEIKRSFQEIVEFAEVDEFLDTPVKRYSSGMYMRLAFAVAAHLEPEVLIVDEVLAVGDAVFQKKCLGKMSDVAKQGRTVLFVSHNLQAVQTLCDRGLFLSRGRVAFEGPVNDSVRHYLDYIQAGTTISLEENLDRGGNGAVRLTNVFTCDERRVVCKDFVAGGALTFNFEYVRNRRYKSATLGFTIFNQLGVYCTHINTSYFDFTLDGPGERGHIVCCIARNPFPIGEYRISVVINADEEVADYIPGCLSFRVISSRFFPVVKVPDPEFIIYCPVMVDHQWRRVPD